MNRWLSFVLLCSLLSGCAPSSNGSSDASPSPSPAASVAPTAAAACSVTIANPVISYLKGAPRVSYKATASSTDCAPPAPAFELRSDGKLLASAPLTGIAPGRSIPIALDFPANVQTKTLTMSLAKTRAPAAATPLAPLSSATPLPAEFSGTLDLRPGREIFQLREVTLH